MRQKAVSRGDDPQVVVDDAKHHLPSYQTVSININSSEVNDARLMM